MGTKCQILTTNETINVFRAVADRPRDARPVRAANRRLLCGGHPDAGRRRRDLLVQSPDHPFFKRNHFKKATTGLAAFQLLHFHRDMAGA